MQYVICQGMRGFYEYQKTFSVDVWDVLEVILQINTTMNYCLIKYVYELKVYSDHRI
jgi:hypothetical protein